MIYMVQVGEKALSDFETSAYQTVEDIQGAYKSTLRKLRQKGPEFIYEMERRMRQGWGWYAYMPPEARGAMIASLHEVMT